MSNRSWFTFALLLVALLMLDIIMGWQAHLFLARKLAGLVEFMAFWR